MYHRIFIFLLCALLIGCTTIDETKSLETNTGLRDDFFIDDTQAFQADASEGSAAEREFSEDVEDGSSGIGPDDEDATAGEGSGSGYSTTPAEYESSTLRIVTPTPTPRLEISTLKEVTTEKITEPTSSVIPGHVPSISEIPTASRPSSTEVEHKSTTEDSQTTKQDSKGSTIMGRTLDNQATSFFSQPGILAAVIGGAVVGLLCAILLVMFIVYRMRKKDEGKQYHEKYLNLR